MTVAMAMPVHARPRAADTPCSRCAARPFSVCAAIPQTDLDRLASASVESVAKPRTTFVTEGEAATDFFNISSGTARLFKLLPDGRRQITGFASAGHFLGLAVSESYAFNAEAIDTVRYCRFPRAKLRQLIDDYPAMEKRLMRVASGELVAAQDQMLLLGRKNARERLASFLLARGPAAESGHAPPRRFGLPMSRGDIADYLGLTIETISRTMTKLKGDGMIDYAGAADMMIMDHGALRELADGNTTGPVPFTLASLPRSMKPAPELRA